jgi:C1A family cysteine protease
MDGKFPDNYTSGKWVGAHAMLIVGYNETDFIVRNSWGYAWGDAGYFYLPRKFLSENPNWAADFWVVKGQDGTKYFDDIA